jgi:hypothetical protein
MAQRKYVTHKRSGGGTDAQAPVDPTQESLAMVERGVAQPVPPVRSDPYVRMAEMEQLRAAGHAEGGLVSSSAPAPEPEQGLLAKQLADMKKAQELWKQQMRGMQQMSPVEQHISGLPVSDHKKAFLRQHPALLHPANARIAAFHHQQALSEGVPDDTEQMNARILRGVHAEHQLAQIQQNLGAALTTPPPAPAAPKKPAGWDNIDLREVRQPPSYDGKRFSDKSVTLSQAEREHARLSGIDEYQYGRNKLRMLKEKENGRYMEPS